MKIFAILNVRFVVAFFVATMFGALGFAASATAPASVVSASPGYCLAIRGNGELAPAHWGALAKVVEKMGLPKAMSGGSSASISLFLLESIAQNPLLKTGSPDQQRATASLLLKSLQAYLEVIASRPEWQEMAQMASYLKAGDGEKMEFVTWLKTMLETNPLAVTDLVIQNRAKIEASLTLATSLGILDPQTLTPLLGALTEARMASDPIAKVESGKRVQFFSGEIYSSVTLLGKFNAETDQNIFFRSGVINFKQLAVSFGRVGNFYAGREMDAKRLRTLKAFSDVCAPSAAGRTWDDMRKAQPQCDVQFKALLEDYRNSGLPKIQASRDTDRVGATIPSFPGTAVLKGDAFLVAKNALGQYPLSLDPTFGKDFVVKSEDVGFGYWGPLADLARIEKNLKTPFKTNDGRAWDFSQDAKSLRFYPLGDESWAQVLGASPAEPGLAPMQEIVTAKARVYSAGGWSDLHPGAVLKAAGCENVVYVTRRGGESLFGQGVAKRLLGFDDVAWARLATDAEHKPANKLRNNNGDPSDMKSQWSRLYNLANPESSFNRALQVFDSVVCTDWDRFDIQAPGAVSGMIADAYNAPWVSKSTTPASARAVDPTLGFPPYAGCLPF
ncbi:hypothetical protein BH10BDE1_BH10BDE1_30180 [soil metagenome]